MPGNVTLQHIGTQSTSTSKMSTAANNDDRFNHQPTDAYEHDNYSPPSNSQQISECDSFPTMHGEEPAEDQSLFVDVTQSNLNSNHDVILDLLAFNSSVQNSVLLPAVVEPMNTDSRNVSILPAMAASEYNSLPTGKPAPLTISGGGRQAAPGASNQIEPQSRGEDVCNEDMQLDDLKLASSQTEASSCGEVGCGEDRPLDNLEFVSSQSSYEQMPKSSELTLYNYQKEIAVKSADKADNDIIILPTGTGKTYVAIHIINNHLQRMQQESREPKVMFMAPAIELVNQQYAKICEFVEPNYRKKVKKITGSSEQSYEKLMYEFTQSPFSIFVATPQILENYLESSQKASIAEFSLIVFDEFHHSKKEHPYNRLLGRYLAELDRGTGICKIPLPQLVGLTASVGVGKSNTTAKAKDFILDMCARMNLSTPPSAVINHRDELDKRTNKPDEVIRCVARRRQDAFSIYIQVELMPVIEKALMVKINELAKVDLKSSRSLKVHMDHISKDKTTQAYDQWCTNLLKLCKVRLDSEELKPFMKYCISGFTHLQLYSRALALVQDTRCEDGLKYLKEKMRDKIGSKSEELQIFDKQFKESLSHLSEFAEKEKDNPNPKLIELKNLLNKIYEENNKSRVLIFVRRRDITKYLSDWIEKELGPKWKPKPFTTTGQSVESGGMAPGESADAMSDMRNGVINALVSTSVAEEGIDIPECNATIRYMYIKDVISKIQARGRTRAQNGKIISIVDLSLAEQDHNNQFKEMLMEKALNLIRDMDKKEFSIELKERQKIAQLEIRFLSGATGKGKQRAKLASPDFLCGKCGVYLSNLAKVRCYSNVYLAWDEEIEERCMPGPTEDDQLPIKGVQVYGKLLCKANCNNVVGKIVTIRNMKFGIWKIDAIRVKGGNLYKKWVALKRDFDVQTMKLSDLLDEGQNYQLDL